MRLYLDLCSFNRPYDDQSQTRIRLETEAKLVIQQKIRDGQCELIWSSTLDFENSQNPFEEHMQAIREWRKLSVLWASLKIPHIYRPDELIVEAI